MLFFEGPAEGIFQLIQQSYQEFAKIHGSASHFPSCQSSTLLEVFDSLASCRSKVINHERSTSGVPKTEKILEI